jgi:hypothetical protein
MTRVMFSAYEVAAMIVEGKKLVLAGDEKTLARLPPGEWIGGTIPYFMAERGGLFSKEKIYVTEMPSFAVSCGARTYGEADIKEIYKDIPENGFAIAIIPASSPAHLSFAVGVPNYEAFATRPLVGWISGVDLKDLGTAKAKVFCGKGGSALEDGAAVMHVALPATKYAEVNILNIFEPGTGDSFVFPETGFSVTDAEINGKRGNLAEHLLRIKADTRLPLVADYCGAMVNTSFQSVDAEKKSVAFYAPVFKGMEYRLAAPVADYVSRFIKAMPELPEGEMLFSCNCILNYLYSELEGKRTGEVTGPITFGEIAYQLLNQTLVYLTLSDA